MRASGSMTISSVGRSGADQVVSRYSNRLANFIWRRVPDRLDPEDILQEVFYEFVEAGESAHPIDQIGAWLFQVARNRIIDLFRKKKPERFSDLDRETNEEERFHSRTFCLRPMPGQTQLLPEAPCCAS